MAAYTPECFVIGADGLRTDSSGVVTTHAQKIFPIQQNGLVCAYAWAGQTRIFYGDRPHFDFVEQSQLAISDLAEGGKDFFLDEYVKEFAQALNDRLALHNLGTPIPACGPVENEIARVIFVGYGRNVPARVEVSLFMLERNNETRGYTSRRHSKS